MAQKTNMVTIPLEEYKELLLRNKPKDNNETIMFNKIIDEIERNLIYTKDEYYSSIVMKNVKVKDSDKIMKEIMSMIKYIDFDRYMTIWNNVMTNHRKEEEEKMKIEQMNKAKEIRKEKDD